MSDSLYAQFAAGDLQATLEQLATSSHADRHQLHQEIDATRAIAARAFKAHSSTNDPKLKLAALRTAQAALRDVRQTVSSSIDNTVKVEALMLAQMTQDLVKHLSVTLDKHLNDMPEIRDAIMADINKMPSTKAVTNTAESIRMALGEMDELVPE